MGNSINNYNRRVILLMKNLQNKQAKLLFQITQMWKEDLILAEDKLLLKELMFQKDELMFNMIDESIEDDEKKLKKALLLVLSLKKEKASSEDSVSTYRRKESLQLKAEKLVEQRSENGRTYLN
eukprot:TRINITY_DN368_c0_g1_i8.p1 TRINITY_DN368_c0_g1~~TRINITY_DN368_c0_g1_i8.p1  ORF type:complete len:124 (-),score=23.94 TRINITY_DN368_c0_g1_i8:133-504(-)